MMHLSLFFLLLFCFLFLATIVVRFFRTGMMKSGEDINHASFLTEHRSMLALVANAAAQCVHSRIGECLLDSLFSAEPELLKYPEVSLLLEVHEIRRALRNIQEGPAHSRPSFYTVVRMSLRRMHETLPDPLLLALGGAMEKLRDRPEESRALEPYILDLVEYIQIELLRETKLLQRRGESITLRLRAVPPFVTL